MASRWRPDGVQMALSGLGPGRRERGLPSRVLLAPEVVNGLDGPGLPGSCDYAQTVPSAGTTSFSRRSLPGDLRLGHTPGDLHAARVEGLVWATPFRRQQPHLDQGPYNGPLACEGKVVPDI